MISVSSMSKITEETLSYLREHKLYINLINGDVQTTSPMYKNVNHSDYDINLLSDINKLYRSGKLFFGDNYDILGFRNVSTLRALIKKKFELLSTEDNLRLYGDIINNKKRKTYFKNHNSKYKKKQLREKYRNTIRERYGVDNPSQNEKIKQKKLETVTKNFGGFGFSSQKLNEKITNTIRERYGVDNPSQNENIKQKKRETFISNYGVDNVFKSPEFIKQQHNHRVLEDERFSLLNDYRNQLLESPDNKELRNEAIDFLSKSYGTQKWVYLKELELSEEGFTYPELQVKRILEDLGVEFKTHVRTPDLIYPNNEMFELDFLIPEYNLAIEVDGAYWHNTNNIKNIEQHVFKRVMCSKIGIKLVGILDEEIKNDINKVKDIILEGMKSPNIKLDRHDLITRNIRINNLDIPDYGTITSHNLKNYFSYDKIPPYIPPAGYKELKKFGVKVSYYYAEANLAVLIDTGFYNNDIIDTLRENNIQVLSFNVNDIKKPDILDSMINHRLGCTTTKIPARKCNIIELDELDVSTAKNFLNENHLDGYTHSTFRYGLEYEGELVHVCTFSKHRFNKEGYELVRSASKINTLVQGGFRKLVNHFKKNHNVEMIESYVDNNISEGYSYKQFGEFIGKTEKSLKFIVYNQLVSRYKLMKHNLHKYFPDFPKRNEPDYDKINAREYLESRGIYSYYTQGNLIYKI